MTLPLDRRSFLATTTAGLAAAAALPAQAEDKKPIFRISLAQWSLNRRFFKREKPHLDNLDFAATTRSSQAARNVVWVPPPELPATPTVAAPRLDLGADAVARGGGLYAVHCLRCHGMGAKGSGLLPDLRFASADLTSRRLRFTCSRNTPWKKVSRYAAFRVRQRKGFSPIRGRATCASFRM